MAQDKHANMGGSYVINEAGEKVLVQRTDFMPGVSPHQTAPAPAKKPKAAVINKPTNEVKS